MLCARGSEKFGGQATSAGGAAYPITIRRHSLKICKRLQSRMLHVHQANAAREALSMSVCRSIYDLEASSSRPDLPDIAICCADTWSRAVAMTALTRKPFMALELPQALSHPRQAAHWLVLVGDPEACFLSRPQPELIDTGHLCSGDSQWPDSQSKTPCDRYCVLRLWHL